MYFNQNNIEQTGMQKQIWESIRLLLSQTEVCKNVKQWGFCHEFFVLENTFFLKSVCVINVLDLLLYFLNELDILNFSQFDNL